MTPGILRGQYFPLTPSRDNEGHESNLNSLGEPQKGQGYIACHMENLPYKIRTLVLPVS